jgi:ABC-type nitrate/sulfonate/bicarbonate transport system substrate-binding protein
MRKGVNEKESAFRMTTWVFLAVCGIFISDLQRVYGAEQLRPAVLQVPSIDTGTTLLLLYGKRWDLFKQEGLDLRIVVARPNVATATLISGDAQFSAQFQSCYYSAIRGVPVKSFMVINSRAPFHFVARPEIKNVQDLKGKSVGVASLATATHYAAKRAISHFGLNSDRDVTYLALGALQTRLNALENNVIQASILSAPWHLLAKGFGGRELLFLGDVLEMPSGGLCSTDKLLKEDPQLIKRMIRATLNTFRKVKENRADAIMFWSQQLKLDATQAAAVFDDIPKTTSANGILTGEAQQTLIDAGRLLGALQGQVDPNKGVDMSLLKEVLQELGIKSSQ